MRLLVDTSAYSAFMRAHAAIKSSMQRADEIVVNAIVLGELAAGFIKGGRRCRIQEELSRYHSSPRVNILHLTEETAERYGVILNSLSKGATPILINDIWIASSALEHRLQLLTPDVPYEQVSQ